MTTTYVFDPQAFARDHDDLTLDEYRIGDTQLHGWAWRAVAVRERFEEKAQDLER